MSSKKINSKREIQELILPSDYSVDLAEETGIHIGDGSMNIYKKWHKGSYVYSGSAIDDCQFSQYVKNLMKKLYNLYPSHEKIQKNTIMLYYTRKELIYFKQKLGLPMGVKANIRIPQWITKNREFKIACISGIFATDGCLLFQKKYKTFNYYPQLKITSKSKALIDQINNSFNELGIKSTISCDKRITPRHPNKIWSAYIYGRINLGNFVEIIGFSNPKHQEKYDKWEKSAAGDI